MHVLRRRDTLFELTLIEVHKLSHEADGEITVAIQVMLGHHIVYFALRKDFYFASCDSLDFGRRKTNVVDHTMDLGLAQRWHHCRDSPVRHVDVQQFVVNASSVHEVRKFRWFHSFRLRQSGGDSEIPAFLVCSFECCQSLHEGVVLSNNDWMEIQTTSGVVQFSDCFDVERVALTRRPSRVICYRPKTILKELATFEEKELLEPVDNPGNQ